MKYVILLNKEHESPAPALIDALREAGITATTMTDATTLQSGVVSDGSAAQPLAVLHEVTAGTDPVALHSVVSHARMMWLGTPLVAYHNAVAKENCDTPLLDGAALKSLGFHAVADEPAQLPALLRALESHGMMNEFHVSSEERAPVPSRLQLPEKLERPRLRAAFAMVATLHFATDQKSAAMAALAGIASMVRADRWTIYVANEVGRELGEKSLEPIAMCGSTSQEHTLPESDWRRALINGASALLPGMESRAARLAFKSAETVRQKEEAQFIVAVPFVYGGRVLGILEAVRESGDNRAFAVADAALLSTLALPLAAAIANSVRIAHAERLSLTDDLTKLNNARFLRQYLISEIKRARRYNSTLSALFLDLDDFKQTNDQHGHLVGSHVLMEMATAILASVRDSDIVARYGGDEFIVILPETGAEQSARVAERVRERIAKHVFTGGRGLQLRLTASFGVANFPEHAQSPQQLIACADTAMYEAKAARKNCIRFASVTTPDAWIKNQ